MVQRTQYDASISAHSLTHTVQYTVRRKQFSIQFDGRRSVHSMKYSYRSMTHTVEQFDAHSLVV